MVSIEEQIQAQRSQIETERQVLQEAKTQVLTKSEQELRGIDRTKRKPKSALVLRAERKGARETLETQERGVEEFEVGFEKEVASKAPRYGKEQYVEEEYQIAKNVLNEKITNIDARIQEKQDKIKEYYEKERKTGRDYDDVIDRFEDDIDLLQSRKQGYEKANKGDKATIIENVNTGYADRLADYEEAKREESIKFKGDVKAGIYDPQISQLGLKKEGLTLSTYQQAIGKYKSEAAYHQQLFAWGEKAGFEKLPEYAKKELISVGAIRYEEIPKQVVTPTLQPALAVDQVAKFKQLIGADKTYAPTDLFKVSLPVSKMQIIEPKLTVVSIPKKTFIEKITQPISEKFYQAFGQQTPKEVFFRLTGSQRDITEPLTPLSIAGELAQVPMRAVSIVGELGAAGTGKLAKTVFEKFPEYKGIEYTFEGRPETRVERPPMKETISDQPRFGIIPAVEERKVLIFEPSKVIEGIEIGTRVGTSIAAITQAPTILFSPGFIASGTETYQTAQKEISKIEPMKYGKRPEGVTDESWTEYKKEIDRYNKELEEQKRKLKISGYVGLGEAALGVGLTAYAGYKYLKEPVYLYKTPEYPTWQKKVIEKPKTTFIEIQQPIVKGEKGVILSRYQIETITPKITVGQFTRGELLKQRAMETIFAKVPAAVPEKVITIPSKVYKVYTPFPTPLEAPTITTAYRVGARYGEVGILKGETIPFEPEAFAQLSKTEKYLWQKVAEDITGKPISLKQVPKVLSKEKELVRGIVAEQRLAKIYTTGDWVIAPAGKTISKYEVAAVSKRIPLEEEIPFQVFKSEVFFKDITKPFARAAGEVDKMTGLIIRKQPIDITPKDVLGFKGGLKKSSEEYLKSLYEQKLLPKVVTAKPPAPAPFKPIVVPVKDSLEAIPKYIGGLGLVESEYAPTETFGLKGGIRVTISDITQEGRLERPSISGIVITPDKVSIREEITPAIKTDLGLKGVTMESQFIRPSEQIKPIEKIKPIEQIKLEQPQKITPKIDLGIKQISKLETKQISKLSAKQVPRPSIKKITPLKVKFKLKIVDVLKAAKKKMKEQPEEFTILVTKFKKEVEVGKAPTKLAAKAILRKELLGTLRAGGFIMRGGEKLMAEEIELGAGFKPSKVDPFKVVQERERRLGGFGERREIQYFKKVKQKSKRGKSSSWLS